METTRDPKAWAAWLNERLAERNWRQADLVNSSEGHIKRDRASKWVRGVEAPTHRLAIVTANTLGVPHSEALEAAGFTVKVDPDKQAREAALAAALDRIADSSPLFSLERLLSDVPDSDLLKLLQLRAYRRESEQLEEADIHVSSSDENAPTGRQSDYARVAKKRSKDRGEEHHD